MSRHSPDLDEFVRLVDIHVTPHMTRLRYVRLHASAGQGESEAILTAVDRHPLRALLRRFSFLRVRSRPSATVEFTIGYEAEGFEVAERLYPADPHTGEEVWLSFEPLSGRLSFGGGLLEELTARHTTDEDAVLLTSPDTSLPERLRTIDSLLARYVAETLVYEPMLALRTWHAQSAPTLAGTAAFSHGAGHETGVMTSAFAGFMFPREVMSVAVRWYLRYGCPTATSRSCLPSRQWT